MLGQILADSVDPYQAEFNILYVLFNLGIISEMKADKYVQDIPAYAKQAIPAWFKMINQQYIFD